MYYGRGRNKIQKPYTLKDTYEFYCEDIGSNPVYELEYKLYIEICHEFYKEIMNYIVEHAGFFKMPYKLGTLHVLKEKVDVTKLNGQAIDWAATNKYGKIIYHLNEHSNGYKYSYQWDKKKSALKNLYFYRLVPTRDNKRRLARLIKSGDYDYWEK